MITGTLSSCKMVFALDTELPYQKERCGGNSIMSAQGESVLTNQFGNQWRRANSWSKCKYGIGNSDRSKWLLKALVNVKTDRNPWRWDGHLWTIRSPAIQQSKTIQFSRSALRVARCHTHRIQLWHHGGSDDEGLCTVHVCFPCSKQNLSNNDEVTR